MTKDKINIAILGASGYTGGELIRLLLGHDKVNISTLSANSNEGLNPSQIHHALLDSNLPNFINIKDIDYSNIDLVFSGLPHNKLHNYINNIGNNSKVIDMSADFRFNDVELFNKSYESKHKSENLLKDSVYGLSEIYRDKIKEANIVACPGCYPTAVLLSILPLIRGNIISLDDIIIDAKSGVSGAGRSLKGELLFSEIAESMKPYNISNHRHTPEIEEKIYLESNKKIKINFTPHLIPINRGELVTIYLKLENDKKLNDAIDYLNNFYANDDFIIVSDSEVPSSTSNVRGSNKCLISLFEDRIDGRIIISTAIDNLVKGSAGQAIQNMNIMFGYQENLGLLNQPLFP
jgi:N-acetyl-gamma-glutamyl-phosphate reductase